MNIDELVVTLSLDPKNFTDGQRKALDAFKKTQDEFEKRIKDLGEVNQKTGDSFETMTSAAEGFFGVVAGAGMGAYAKQTITAAAAAGRMATNIGVATDESETFALMVGRVGGSADAAKESLKGYADQIQNIKAGKGASEDFWRGWSMADGKLSDTPIDIVAKLAKKAKEEHWDAQKLNQVGRWLGLNPDISNLAQGGPENFRKEYDDAHKDATTKKQSDAMAKMQHSWTRLSDTMKTAGRGAVEDIIGPFGYIADHIADWAHGNQFLAKSIFELVSAITALKAVMWIWAAFKKIGSLVRAATVAAEAAEVGGAVGAGVILPVAAAVGTAAIAAGAITGAIKPTGFFEEQNKEHPFLGKIDSFFGLNGGSANPNGAKPAGVRDAGMSYFQSQGWTKEQAAALMGNVEAESSFDPNASNNIGGGHKGLFQWGKSRRKSILEGTGIDVWNAAAQQQFEAAQWELTHTEKAAGDGLKKINSAGIGGAWIDQAYERSGDSEAQMVARGNKSQRIADLPAFGSSPPTAPSDTGDHRELTKPSPNMATASNNTTVTSEVNVGQVVVHSKSDNPQDHGREAAAEIRKRVDPYSDLASQANTGLN